MAILNSGSASPPPPRRFFGDAAHFGCHQWSRRALLSLRDAARGEHDELHLRAARECPRCKLKDRTRWRIQALHGSLAIAEAHDNAVIPQLPLLSMLPKCFK